MEFVFFTKGSRYHDSPEFSATRFGREPMRDDTRSLRRHCVASQVHCLHDANKELPDDSRNMDFSSSGVDSSHSHRTHFSASATVFAVTLVRKCVLEFLPMIFLTLATIHMLVIVRRHKKEISSLLADLQYNRPISDEKPKIFRRIPEASSATVVAVVVFIFVFCYAIETYLFFCTVCPSALIDVVLFFFLLNAAANPLAYAFLKKDIRRELGKVFRDNCLHRKVVSHK